MKLVSQNYGKARVRLCKVLRDGPVHSVKELTVRIALEGEFAASYQSGDNSCIVPTDSMKNAINVLAYHHLGVDNEPFALAVADHFLNRYAQVTKAVVEIEERSWSRLVVGGAPHPHSFAQTQRATPLVRLVQTRTSTKLESGVQDFTLLKTTGSGFSGFATCEHTTLPPTEDRLLATTLKARWTWNAEPASYQATTDAFLRAVVVPFAGKHSPSVQATLWEMAAAAFEACPEIQEITLTLPNHHYFTQNLRAFGIDNTNVLMLPSEEPHGQIEATISRN